MGRAARFRRRARARALGLVDAIVGLVILVLIAAAAAQAYGLLAQVTRAEETRTDALVQHSDAAALASWL